VYKSELVVGEKHTADIDVRRGSNRQKLAEQREKLKRVVKKLDHPGASMNVARLALGMMEKKRAEQPQVVG